MIKNFVLDVDGVLTDGKFLYSAEGKVYKTFGAHDADGLKLLKSLVDIKFISADKRGFDISRRRIEDMGYELTLVSEQSRYDYIRDSYGFEQTIYMGDGIHDAPIIAAVAFGVAPRSGRKEAKQAADFVTESNAGEGAVCDACIEIKNRFFGEQK